MKEYIEHIIVPYVNSTQLQLISQHQVHVFLMSSGASEPKALWIYQKRIILDINIPADCTDCLQPMDLSINNSVKDFLRNKLTDWYFEQVHQQLTNEEEIAPVDLKMSMTKPLGARWLVSLHDYILTGPQYRIVLKLQVHLFNFPSPSVTEHKERSIIHTYEFNIQCCIHVPHIHKKDYYLGMCFTIRVMILFVC